VRPNCAFDRTLAGGWAGGDQKPRETAPQIAVAPKQQRNVLWRRYRRGFIQAKVDSDAQPRTSREDLLDRVPPRRAIRTNTGARKSAVLMSLANALIEGVEQAEIVGF